MAGKGANLVAASHPRPNPHLKWADDNEASRQSGALLLDQIPNGFRHPLAGFGRVADNDDATVAFLTPSSPLPTEL